MHYKKMKKNPQLLTLVNPGKPPRKAGGKKVPRAKARKAKTTRKVSPKARKAMLANLKKARAAYKRKHGPSASINRKAKPRRRPSAASQPKVSARKARTKKARKLGVKKQGWYPRSGPGTASRWTWVGNAGKKRRRKKAALKRRAAPKRRTVRRKVTRRRSYRRNPRTVRRAAPKRRRPVRRKATRRKATRRRSYRRNPVTRKRRRRSYRKQSPAQRRASLRNIRKAQAARRRKGYRRNPTRRRKARKTRSRRRYRRNTGMMAKIMAYVKPAIAGGVGFFSSRLAGNIIAQQNIIPIPDAIRPYVPLAANILCAVTAPTVLKHVDKIGPMKGVKKYSEAVVVGALVAAVENVVNLFAPPSVQMLVSPAPLWGMSGMGDALSVYERALSGYGGRGNGNMNAILAADDGVGEYIVEPGFGEYITEPGMGEYITEPGMGGVEVSEAFAGMGEYIREPGMGLDVSEAFAGDYDLAGVEVHEAVAGLDGFDVQADEGLADHILKNETGGGIFGEGAARAPGEAVREVVNEAAASAMAQGLDRITAARIAYSSVKSAMGLHAGDPSLRAAVIRAVNRVYSTGGAALPAAPANYSRTPTNMPVDGAPGPIEPIGYTLNDPAAELTSVDDPLTENVGGIFAGSIFGKS